MDQLRTTDSQTFFICCFLSSQPLQYPTLYNESFIYIPVDIVANGDEQRQGRVEVGEVIPKSTDENFLRGIKDKEIKGSMMSLKKRGYATFGFTIDFKVHYPENTVSFGVHMLLPIKVEKLKKTLGVDSHPSTSEGFKSIINALEDPAVGDSRSVSPATYPKRNVPLSELSEFLQVPGLKPRRDRSNSSNCKKSRSPSRSNGSSRSRSHEVHRINCEETN